MIVTMWILIMIIDPEEFNEWARTKDNLERMIAPFTLESDCRAAMKAMEREAQISFRHHKYECVLEQMWKHQS